MRRWKETIFRSLLPKFAGGAASLQAKVLVSEIESTYRPRFRVRTPFLIFQQRVIEIVGVFRFLPAFAVRDVLSYNRYNPVYCDVLAPLCDVLFYGRGST